MEQLHHVTGQLDHQCGVTFGQAFKSTAVNAYQQAVANGLDSGTARFTTDQADFSDAITGYDFTQQTGLTVGIFRFDPGLQTTPYEKIERVTGITLAEQPLSSMQHPRLKLLQQLRVQFLFEVAFDDAANFPVGGIHFA